MRALVLLHRAISFCFAYWPDLDDQVTRKLEVGQSEVPPSSDSGGFARTPHPPSAPSHMCTLPENRDQYLSGTRSECDKPHKSLELLSQTQVVFN